MPKHWSVFSSTDIFCHWWAPTGDDKWLCCQGVGSNRFWKRLGSGCDQNSYFSRPAGLSGRFLAGIPEAGEKDTKFVSWCPESALLAGRTTPGIVRSPISVKSIYSGVIPPGTHPDMSGNPVVWKQRLFVWGRPQSLPESGFLPVSHLTMVR